MTRMGMDVERVEQAGRQLKSQAGKIDALIKEINGVVSRLPTVWDGPDAQRFVNDWWPKHRQTLIAAQHEIDGLGQSALNNSTEQRQVSSVAGGAVSSAATGAAAAGTAAVSHSSATGASSTQTQAAAGFVEKYKGHAINYDNSYGAQCFDVFRQYSHDVAGAPNGVRVGSDHASDIYYNYGKPGNDISSYYDRIPAGQGQPQPGDVIVYDGGPVKDANGRPYGHVAVISGVGQNGNYQVLEQNYYLGKGQDRYDANGFPLNPAAVRSHNTADKNGLTILGYLRPKNPHA